jgi:hypothetical protein
MPLRKGSQHSANDLSLPQGQLAISFPYILILSNELTDPNRCMAADLHLKRTDTMV